MNIKYLLNISSSKGKHTSGLYTRMERSLKNTHIDIEKSIRLAKTLAPIICDQSSNERHLNVIDSDARVHEKVIAILMVGFPGNRQVLPVLRAQLRAESEAIRMAAVISIGQMRDGENNALLAEILVGCLDDEMSLDVKKTLNKTLVALHHNSSQPATENVLRMV